MFGNAFKKDKELRRMLQAVYERHLLKYALELYGSEQKEILGFDVANFGQDDIMQMALAGDLQAARGTICGV